MITTINTTLKISTPGFKNDDFIPIKYTCIGENISPALNIQNLPEETESLVLIMDDPDAPYGTFDHWIMWNIPPVNRIEEGKAPGIQGMNSQSEYGYTGPCPPRGNIHHYHIKLYALDTQLDVPQSIHKNDLLKIIDRNTIAFGEIIGLFKS